MKIKILLIVLFFGLGALNAYAANSCDLPIQKAMNYIQQDKNNGLAWTDVCSMPDQATSVAPPQTVPSFNDRVNTFSIAQQTFYYRSNQANTPLEAGRKNSGLWEGIEGSYVLRPPQGSILNTPVFNYYALEGLYARGQNDTTTYQVLDNNAITKLTIKDIPGYMFDNRILLGRDFIPLPSLRLTPYTGFGIRYLTDQSAGHSNILQDNVTDILGFNRSDLFYYIPIGLTFDLAANNGYEVSLNMEYDYLVKGYARYDFANFDKFTLPADSFTNQNMLFSQDHGYGLRTSLKFLKHFSLVDVYVKPYIRYWYIGTSKAASGFVGDQDVTTVADKNSTVEAGCEFGIQF